ncbi:MAG: hypothetical protein J1E40_04125 [Oscillospiraceae bacterium]|nr:hypothetical protein [Oscillospiraceae bacterium]
MAIIAFIIIWLISPIVLLILFLIQLSNVSDLKKQNRELLDTIKLLTEERDKNAAKIEALPDEAAPSEVSGHEEAPVQSQPDIVQGTETDPVQLPSSLPYDMPYIRPVNNVQKMQTPKTAISSDKDSEIPSKPEKTSAFTVQTETQEKKSVSTINIILILGALLISLSGFIFAIAAWGALNTFFKSVVLLSFSAIFFGIHSIAERKLELPQTGRVFYMLGSIFLPAAVAAAGALELFGEYLSFSGDGMAFILAAMFLSICIPAFKGGYDYKSHFASAVSFFSFSAAIVSLIWQLSPDNGVFALVTSVFTLAIVITQSIVQKMFAAVFGEDSVFIHEWNRFSEINTWILSIISLFAAENGFITLSAFTIFSICFLARAITGKERNGTTGGIAFAFFITAALFTGFDPDDMSGFTVIIAATSLIYAVLSAMGILPDALKNAMRILAVIAASAAGLLGIIENVILISENEIPSLTLVFASAAVFAQLLILTLRNRNREFRAMSFGAMLWFSAEVILLISGNSVYTFFIAYLILLGYFCAVRFTKLRDMLYSPVNDIIIALYAVISMIICIYYEYTPLSGILSLIIIAAGVISAGASNREKISIVICPLLTAFAVFPVLMLFEHYNVLLLTGFPASNAISATVILICIIASVLLFINRAESYAKAYGIAVIASVPIFTIFSCGYMTSDFIPMLAVTAYAGLYLFKSAFPMEKYSHIILFWTSVIITAFFVGGYLTESLYLLLFPAAVLLLIFAVYIIAYYMDGFENTGEATEHFLWYAVPALSGIMILAANTEECLPVMIFGAVLALCGLFLSVFRKNTMAMIFPLVMALVFFGEQFDGDPAAAFAIILAITGHIMFNKKMFDKLYCDIFSIGAFVAALEFLSRANTDMREWVGIIILAALTANLIRQEHSLKTNKSLITAASAFILPVWWAQPFFTLPQVISLEVNLVPLIIFCVLLKLIWKDAPGKTDNFSFVAAIISLVVLFIGALDSGMIFDSVFIGIVIFIMLAISFIIKKKRWFVLAVASMVVSAVLLSLGQWNSIAWLVYLALAGAALIALGVVNELKKQQKRNGEDTKLTRFMSDWTW